MKNFFLIFMLASIVFTACNTSKNNSTANQQIRQLEEMAHTQADQDEQNAKNKNFKAGDSKTQVQQMPNKKMSPKTADIRVPNAEVRPDSIK